MSDGAGRVYAALALGMALMFSVAVASNAYVQAHHVEGAALRYVSDNSIRLNEWIAKWREENNPLERLQRERR